MKIIHGNSLEVLAGLPEASVDACVTDPPYHLVSIHKRFAKSHGADRQPGTEAFGRLSRGFMGSGSTGKAAIAEGFDFIGVDMDPEYIEIACRRLRQALEDAYL